MGWKVTTAPRLTIQILYLLSEVLKQTSPVQNPSLRIRGYSEINLTGR